MAIASRMISVRPTNLSIDRAKRCNYTSRNLSILSCQNRSNCGFSLMHAVKPISALVKENSGHLSNMIGSSSLCNDLNKNDDDTIKCHWKKTDTVAEIEDKKQLKRTNTDKITRKSKSKLPSKLYTIAVGASFCILVGLCSYGLPKLQASNYIDVPYSDLLHGVKDGSVTRVQFVEDSRLIYFNKKPSEDQTVETPKTDSLTGKLQAFIEKKYAKWDYYTRNVEDDKYELVNMLKDKGVMYGSNRALLSPSTRNMLLVFFQIAPFWIMVALTCYQLSTQHGLGKLTNKKPSKKQSVTFDDVKGVDAAKTELLEIVLCMKGDSKYMKLGAKLPKGVLLTGQPGTGKTLLARAVAGEAGVSFFSISASELVEVFVGRGAARVRDLFKEARKSSPSIIFIDEIDAVGGQRGRTLNCERDQTLNQLLTEMDGFDKEESVVVIAATNRPETLDSALMRPGRFSRKVRVDAPDESGRKDIFALYLRDVPMEEDKEDICELVASLTRGLVGADLENIVRESVLLAARRGGEFVKKGDILEAVDRARGKVYDDVGKSKPFPFGPTTFQDQNVPSGGSMGFGYSN